MGLVGRSLKVADASPKQNHFPGIPTQDISISRDPYSPKIVEIFWGGHKGENPFFWWLAES